MTDTQIVPGKRYIVKPGVTVSAYFNLRLVDWYVLNAGACFMAVSSLVPFSPPSVGFPSGYNAMLVLVDGIARPLWLVLRHPFSLFIVAQSEGTA